ncbi:hypothetical protein YPA_1913 [Yersinia pestis Antiqua]|uniref:Transposase n=1 Tax=Yersinia pestis bv. Antiqua (strain Antiqua) TaxID=360102 RepID=A0A0H2Y6V4_YERPA|nr:hypothetical protein YPA_1913 [Yersinia pestis Antiqua]
MGRWWRYKWITFHPSLTGKNTARIQEYIKHQLEEDKMGEQLSIPYPGSPFTGRK